VIDSSSAHGAQDVSAVQPRRGRALTLNWRAALLLIVAAGFAGEQLMFLGDSASAGRTGAGPAQHLTGTERERVALLVAEALGPSDRGVARFHLAGLRADPARKGAQTLDLRWAINGDLSLGSVSSGAQLDVYLVLRTLYTARLPLSSVRMTGTFGQHDRSGRHVETPVMIVGLDAAAARLIDWQDMDASTVWPLVHRYMIQPGFECQCQE